MQVRAWKLAPKFHLFVHVGEIQARHMNPRVYWVYMDEDLMQHIKRIALSLHGRTVCENILFKWVVATFGPQ